MAGLLICARQATAEQDFFMQLEWELRKDRRGIQVYTARVDGSKHRAVFSTMEINARPESVVALLLDLPNCRQWATMCRDARIEQSLSETQSIVYGRNDIPFPVRDRDSYSHVSWLADRDTGTIVMHSEALPADTYPQRKGVVRVDYARASWRIVPIGEGKLIIENYIHIDPNGQLPSWLTNTLIDNAPYKALRKMRSVLKTGRYDQAKIAFLLPVGSSQNNREK